MKSQIKKLEAYFSSQEKKQSIALVYLFGSHAGGSEGPISDYDIAALTETPLLAPKADFRLGGAVLASLHWREGLWEGANRPTFIWVLGEFH